MVQLAELVRELGGRAEQRADARNGNGAGGAADPDVLDVELDSRRVGPGSLFAALVGERFDGARFAADAIERGAAAVLAPRELPLGGRVPLWIHPDARRAAGLAAALVHGRPSSQLFTAAITGTNGKTSVAHLSGQLLEAGGRKPAVLGTVGHKLGAGEQVEARNTTPEATELHRLLARHREQGGDSAVLEASSHGIVQERLAGLELDVAVFTNLTRDHLDYHGDMDAYRAAKRRLFESLAPGATAVVNAGDPAGEEMAAAARQRGARVVRFGCVAGCDLRALAARPELGRTILEVRGLGPPGAGNGGRRRVHLPLVGRHGVENALAAAAVALAAGIPGDVVGAALERVSSAPGRLERVDHGGSGVVVFVDYAHTEQALERVLVTLRAQLAAAGDERGRLYCVFGCGGERDRGKRAPMGAVVNRLADVAVVTSDNPRGEEPEAIIREVLAGMREPGGADVLVEVDRSAAIRRAIEEARPGDFVLIAGKGHERYQIVGTDRRPFDDREVAREALA